MRAIEFLLENKITLQNLYGGNFPDRDETFWDYVRPGELNNPLDIKTLPKYKLAIMLQGQYRVEHLDEILDMMDEDQKEILQRYIDDPNLSKKTIVISGDRIIDGNHRALAAAMRSVPINYVDLADLDEQDVAEAKLSNLVQYHGTRRDINHFKPFTHFGTFRAAYDRLEHTSTGSDEDYKNQKIYQVKLDIKNPIRLDVDIDKDHELNDYIDLMQRIKLLNDRETKSIDSLEKLAKLLISKGYDGIRYKNKVEDPNSISYIIFSPNQAMITDKIEYGTNKFNKLRVAEGISPDTIHKLADRKGIKWDNEPDFLALTKRLTGKKHLDDLDQVGLKKVKKYLEKQGVAEDTNNILDADYYMKEGCGIYAVALALNEPGSQIYIISNKNGESWSKSFPYEITHVFVNLPGQGQYDVRGKRSPEVMATDFNLSKGDYSIKGPFDPKEFFRKFMGSSDAKPLYGTIKDVKQIKAQIKDTLDEMALSTYKTMGDFSKPGPFTGADKKLVPHPKNIEKATRFFEQTPFDFRLFFSHLTGTGKYSEHGPMSPDQIRQVFGQDSEEIINGSEDAITVVYVGNKGDSKVMLTPWMMAHRFGHAINAGARNKNWTAWGEAEKYFFQTVNNLLEEHYGKAYRGANTYRTEIKWDMTPEYNALFNAMGTQRSSKTGQIRRPYEFLYELFAQYLGTGKVTLNPLPTNLTYGKKVFGNPTKFMNIKPEYRDESERKQAADSLAYTMELLFNDVLGDSVGKIFVM